MIVIVVCFCCIFDEESVPLSVVGDIMLNVEVVDTVSSDRSVERSVDRITNNMGLMHSANHMEVDRIAA